MAQGDPAALRQIREDIAGHAAADRLEQLDLARQEWQARITEWLLQRNALLANSALAATDREDAITELRHRLFTPTEYRRVQSLESLHDSSPQF